MKRSIVHEAALRCYRGAGVTVSGFSGNPHTLTPLEDLLFHISAFITTGNDVRRGTRSESDDRNRQASLLATPAVKRENAKHPETAPKTSSTLATVHQSLSVSRARLPFCSTDARKFKTQTIDIHRSF